MRWPAALLAAWTVTLVRGGDVRTDAACKDAVANYCPDVSAGDSAVAFCLMGAFKQAGAATAQLEANGVTTACKLEVRDAMIIANRIPRIGAPPSHLGDKAPSRPGVKASSRRRLGAPGHRGDQGLRAPGAPKATASQACEQDIASLCSGQSGFAAVTCLEAHKAQLSPPCSQRLFRVKVVQPGDTALDAPVFAACQEDLHDPSVCGRSPPSLRDKCLMSKAGDKLSEKCREALVKKKAVDLKGGASHPGGARPPSAHPELQRCMSMMMRERCNGLTGAQIGACFKQYGKDVAERCQRQQGSKAHP